ncbi:MAG: rubrerythrin [Deltaproteobacteria bacterium]|nr:rubrerythrin [Deltaproteobacteria bacterium]
MSIFFNADEIFQMGLRIEVNGKEFYETVAKKSSDGSVKQFFSDLATWESEHIRFFNRLREGLSDSAKRGSTFDPGQELLLYLQSTADSHVFLKNQHIDELASRCQTVVDALDLAMAFEKDSVVFYTMMKKVTPEEFGKKEIDGLIDEELKHIAMLHQKKKEWEKREKTIL